MVHGGIHGYSRLTVYLKASNNNRAETVLQCFKEAVAQFGLPSRVRSDKGGENVQVAAHMLNHIQRGPGRESMITSDVRLGLLYTVYRLILFCHELILDLQPRDKKYFTINRRHVGGKANSNMATTKRDLEILLPGKKTIQRKGRFVWV